MLKVADFGLSEDIYARNYFRQTGLQDSEGETPIKLPVRWMAVESLHDGIFTEKTDVVGVLVKSLLICIPLIFFKMTVVFWSDNVGDIFFGENSIPWN